MQIITTRVVFVKYVVYNVIMKKNYYDATKLLSLKDINGALPELYLVSGNRSAGKTTFFSRYLVKRFLKYGEKFVLIYRFTNELKDVPDKFFKDIGELFFSNYVMSDLPRGNGTMRELFIKNAQKYDGDNKNNVGDSCGYAVALNGADNVKKYSHLLSDVQRGLFDEFQSETNHYAPDEVNKLISIHTSIARGHGEQVRHVPFILCSNTVSLLNPYYTALGISDRLQHDTKFLKGDGYVLEQTFNESASNAQKESGFMRAFAGSDYVKFSAENVYLNDNVAMVEQLIGDNKYLVTVKCDGEFYAIRYFINDGLIYCDTRIDETFKTKLCISAEDMDGDLLMMKTHDTYIRMLRSYFERGVFRFKNLQCKSAIIKLLAYK